MFIDLWLEDFSSGSLNTSHRGGSKSPLRPLPNRSLVSHNLCSSLSLFLSLSRRWAKRWRRAVRLFRVVKVSVTSVSIRPRARRRDRPWKMPAVTFVGSCKSNLIDFTSPFFGPSFTPRRGRCWNEKFCQNGSLIPDLFLSRLLLNHPPRVSRHQNFLLVFLVSYLPPITILQKSGRFEENLKDPSNDINLSK